MPDTHDERGGDEDAALTVAQYADRYMAYEDGRSDMDPGRPPVEAMWRVRKQLRHLRKQLAAATARAEKAEVEVAGLGEPEVEQRLISPNGLVYEPTLRDLENQAYWLPGVRLEERQVYPTPWRVTPDAAQDGLSEPGERSETSGGYGEGSNSSASAAGLSEVEHKTTTCGYLACGYPEHQRNDTTEDGQHG